MKVTDYEIKGSKLVEIPYLDDILSKQIKTDKVLIVGERIATEGILQTVLKRQFKHCLCTDIMPMGNDSPLEDAIKSDDKITFVQKDFIEFDETVKYDYIICINVLEHFGMNFAEFHGFSGANSLDDYIRWHHDLRAIEKMISLLNKTEMSKIIITVPGGQPIMSGDINLGNKMPFLRRYDLTRVEIIRKLVLSYNMKISEKYYYSENFSEWFETDSSIVDYTYHQASNPYSPNIIWAFSIFK